MKAEHAKQLSHDALERLSQALAAGKSESLTAYLKAVAQFHQYSFGNIMLIAAQRPDATRVAGFRTWKKLGRFVRKGEKGIVIIAPMLLRTDDSAASNGEPDVEVQLRFRAVHVFDVLQTDGEPLPEPDVVRGDPGPFTARLEAFVTQRGITLEHDEDLDGSDGVSKGGTIVLRTGLTPAERFSVLAHEVAHELLHRTGERPSRVVRETEAEAVAFVVSEAIGLHNGTAAVDCIQLYHGDSTTLAASLDRIQKTAADIIDGITAEEERS
jgi:antirestriction protein ArdC